MKFVYILRHTNSDRIYIGCTNNLKKRLDEHNAGLNLSTRRKDGTWHLVYAEIYRNEKDALIREKRLKHHGSALHELKRRISSSLS